MPDSGNTCDSAREQSVFVAVLRNHHAVCRYQNRSAELIELLFLVLPGRAVIAHKVLELSQLRIAVSGQHLTVSVNVDSLAIGLLEQLVKIEQIMAGYYDSGARLCAARDGCRRRIAESGRVRLVEHLHNAEIHLAGLQHQPDMAVQIEVHVRQR